MYSCPQISVRVKCRGGRTEAAGPEGTEQNGETSDQRATAEAGLMETLHKRARDVQRLCGRLCWSRI